MRTQGLNKDYKSKINILSQEFQHRHDFDSEDLEVLRNNFPGVKIGNIPEAWIILIDKMLQKIFNHVSAIEQHFGFLVVNYIDYNEKDLYNVKKVVKSFENKLYAIDKDLHQELNYANE